MASGMNRCAISAVLEDEELRVNSSRIECLKRLGNTVLERVIAGDAEMTAFDEFSTNLLSLLRGLFQPANVYRSVSTKREKLWTSFYQICLRQLPEVWEQLFSSLAIEYDESTNQKLFEMLLSSEFSSHSQPQSEKGHGTITEVELSRDELNALRHARGYVPHALLICYEKRSGSKYDKFIECLGEMAVQGADNDLLPYTREWIDRVNRGGMYMCMNGIIHVPVNMYALQQ